MVLLIKTRQGDHHVFDNIKMGAEFAVEYPDDITYLDTYNSVYECIKDEYIHSDENMPDLLIDLSKDVKLDHELITALLCFSGDEDKIPYVVLKILGGL